MKIIKPIVFSFLLLMSALSFSETTMGPFYACGAKHYTCVKGSSGHSCGWARGTLSSKGAHLCTTCSYSTVVRPCMSSQDSLGNAGWTYHCNAANKTFQCFKEHGSCAWGGGSSAGNCKTCPVSVAYHHC